MEFSNVLGFIILASLLALATANTTLRDWWPLLRNIGVGTLWGAAFALGVLLLAGVLP